MLTLFIRAARLNIHDEHLNDFVSDQPIFIGPRNDSQNESGFL